MHVETPPPISPAPAPIRSRSGRLAAGTRGILRSPGLWGLLLVAILGWLLVVGIEALGGPEAIRARYGLTAGIAAIPVQAIVAVSPVPGELVALANSAVYGFWLGSLFNWIGWMLAAFLEYALFRRLAADADPGADVARMPAWLRRFPAHHPIFLIGARWLPFGGHVVNGMAGTHRVSMRRFAWTSAVALVPGSMLIAAIANGLVSLS